MRKWTAFLLSIIVGYSNILHSQQPQERSIAQEYATQRQIDESNDNFRKGYYYYNNMAYETAIAFFRSALDAYPNNDLAAYWLGRAHYMAGYNDLAISVWESLQRKNLSNPDLYLQQELEKLYVRGLRNSLGADSSVAHFSLLRMINTFSNPSYIASDSQNNFYISDFYKNNINVYNANLRKIRTLDTNIDKPINLAFNKNLLYVSSFGNDTVQVFDMGNNYRLLHSIGGFGFGLGELAGPVGLAFSGDKLYVVDQGNNRVQIFQTLPKPYFIGSFGSRGDSPGEFNLPTGIAIYKDKVWVLDSMNHRVQIFDLEGNYISQISSRQIQNPLQAFVFQERLYVVDRDNGFFVLSEDGKTFQLLQKPTQGLQRSTSGWIDNNGILFLSEVSNPTVIAYARYVDKISPLNLQPVFVSTSAYPNIVMKLRIQDAKGQDIRGLSKNDFVVTQDGVQMDDIYLAPLIPENDRAALTIVVRNTKDMTNNRSSVVKYIHRIIGSMKAGDRIRLMFYNKKSTVMQSFTQDPLVLRNVLDNFPWEEESGSEDVLDQALYEAASSSGFNDSHNAILLIDNSTPSSFDKYSGEVVAHYAQRIGVPIYAVSMDVKDTLPKSQLMRYISEASGGRSFSFAKSNDLFDILDITRKNSPQYYTLSYTNPPLNNALHGYWANVVIRLNYRSLHGVGKVGYLVDTVDGN